MSEGLRNFLSQDAESLAASNKDYTPHVQKTLSGIFSQCAEDT